MSAEFRVQNAELEEKVMSFEEKNGVYEVRLNNGDVVRFDSYDEMMAAQAMYDDMEALFGRGKEAVASWPVVQAPKKKVRIHIDPEVEYVPRDSDNGPSRTSVPTKAKRKALA